MQLLHRGFGLVLVLNSLLLLVSCQVQQPRASTRWLPAIATWYGNPEGDGSDGGACGYGSMVDVKPFRARVGAVNPVLFKSGEGCGACYKIKCLDQSICSRRPVTIIVTDECPGCSKGPAQFDLSGAAFGRMAVSGEGGLLRNQGELSVLYRRTPCKYPGKQIAFHVNEGSTNYWLSLLVEFEDGDGDVGSMHIRPASCPSLFFIHCCMPLATLLYFYIYFCYKKTKMLLVLHIFTIYLIEMRFTYVGVPYIY
ncbi:unnamed protein product [Malus baccata var. baccata]